MRKSVYSVQMLYYSPLYGKSAEYFTIRHFFHLLRLFFLLTVFYYGNLLTEMLIYQ